ncbi:DUF551 domain-containing protein [Enterobacter kobei]|uniref:DUF551 domain-containing protein n=1 Tax=Enterobacter kobei TaxID=208224 RepID=UPI003ED92E9A
MITFTKEQLIASAHARIEFAEMMLAGELEPLTERTLSIELELSRRALASLEAESVPEWTNKQCLEFLSIAFRHAEIKGDLELDDIRLGVKMVNGSRDAMLQGAEHVTTAYKLPFEQWLSQQTGTIEVECGCVMTEVFFHWLRVAYESGNSPAIQDGWVACSERMPEVEGHYLVWANASKLEGYCNHQDIAAYQAGQWSNEFGWLVTHWMPLPTAPQQEVK